MRRALVVVAALVLLVPAIGTAAAGPGPIPNDPTTTPDAGRSNETTTNTWIDNATQLVSASYNSGDGTATVVITSEIPQQITISDSGAFVSGGEVRQRSVVVTPGETAKITMPVTKAKGFVGVSITTQKTLYAVPLKSEISWFQGESTWGTVQIAALGGASGVLLMAGIVAYRLRSGGSERTERIA